MLKFCSFLRYNLSSHSAHKNPQFLALLSIKVIHENENAGFRLSTKIIPDINGMSN